jgi:Holliday junction resolvase
MSAANKAKGSKFEIDVENYLNDSGVKARRLPRSGSKDIGDVSVTLSTGKVIVLEAKNVKTANMKEFLRQAEVEAENYEAKYGAVTYPMVVQKARQQPISEGRVTMTLDTLVNLLMWEGLS